MVHVFTVDDMGCKKNFRGTILKAKGFGFERLLRVTSR